MSALIEFDDVCKYYQMGDTTVKAVDHISMQINKGEFVAIVGQSGSGKSTCMNIIGCLDVPTSGTYRLNGRDVGSMSKNELAEIRNEMLGFIFQQYNLLPKLSLMENVELPLIYAGLSRKEQQARARTALQQVGLGDKLNNKPSQLSGGQQQRASIARALAGGPAVILADEPTGALDSHTGREVLGILQKLHRQGNTVVLITHDNSIAVQAERIIRLEDGHIVYDGGAHRLRRRCPRPRGRGPACLHRAGCAGGPGATGTGGQCMNLSMLYETVRQALKNIASNKFRTLLTMLGIIIGIMAVMIIVGLGNGLTQSMRASVSSMGMNLLQVNVFGPRARNVSVDEMYRITEERPDLFSGISPMVSMDRTSSAVRVGTKNYSQTSVIGISETYAGMTGTKIAEGRGIQYVDCAEYKRVCVVGDYIARVAYGGNAIGQTLKLGPDQFTIIGVAAAEVSDPSLQEGSSDDYVYIPYTTAQRVARSSNVSAYGVTTVTEAQVAEGKAVLEAGLQELTHSEDSYFVTSLSEVLNTFSSMIGMVVSVLTVIAAISLLVGGIGIMNIMMVSVAERTREIGIRKALGAKERTILALFVTEAATTSALGGLIGIILGYGVSAAASPLVAAVMGDTNMTISPSAGSVAVAFGVSVGIGILFGYLPAKRAARLNPIEALRYD